LKNPFYILIVSSTEHEIKKFEKKLIDTGFTKRLNTYEKDHLKIEILISGIGSPHTVYNLTTAILKDTYDMVINAGICGSFKDDFPVGTCVHIISDTFADLGMSYPDNSFKTLFEEGLMKAVEMPYTEGQLMTFSRLPFDLNLPKVKGITVNNCSGNKEQIKERTDKFNADIESMEGAALAFVCLQESIDFLQIRAVSNKIEPRNKDNWDIKTATDNLAVCLLEIINKMYEME
jgi:futalosine hydrolase